MSDLAEALQNTIQNLETLRDAGSPPSEVISEALDALYDQQIDLIEATINTETANYQQATKAIQEAATKTQQAINDLTELENAVQKVADAIGKISGLLARVT